MYSIRQAVMQDASTIADIHHSCWQECYPYLPKGLHDLRDREVRFNQWLKRLEGSGDFQTNVLEVSGAVAGFAHVKANDDDAIPEADAELHACYFRPHLRRSSAGPAMMKQMLLWTREQGMTACSVWAWRQNPIRRTYGALGLEIACKRDRQIAGFRAPEVGYLCRDIPSLIQTLEKMISQLDARGGQARSRQFAPSRLSPIEIRDGKARERDRKSLLPTPS